VARGGRRLRGTLGWLSALVLVPAGFAAAAHVAQPPDPPRVTHELFPLDPGTTWVYAVSDHGRPSGTHTRQVLGEAQLTGIAKALVHASRVGDSWTDYPGQGVRRTSAYFAPQGDAIDQYGLIDGTHRLQQLDPPARVYELLDDVGDSWTYTGKLDLQELTFTTELAERGPVTVSGHTFEGCSHFVTTIPIEIEGQPKTEETQEEWSCPGYGPVRSSDRYEPSDFDLSEELVEFHGENENWYADGPEQSDDETAPETALGFDRARTSSFTDGQLGRDLAWSVGRSQVSNFPPVSSGDVMVTGDSTGLVAATNVSTGEPVWQVQLEPPILVTPAMAGGDVVVADGSKALRALSLADGSTRWVRELDDVASVSPGVTDDAVVAATEDGRLTALELDDGSVRWSQQLGGTATTAPAVDGDRVFVCDKSGAITAYDVDDGEPDWSRSLANGLLRGPVVVGGRVLAQDDTGIIYELDEDDGTLGWQSRTRGVGYGHLAATDDLVATLISTTDLVVVDADTGDRVWRTDVPTTQVAPVVVGDELLTVSERGRVQLLDLATGHETGDWELPRPVRDQEPRVDVAVGVVGDSVVISSGPGTLPAFSTLYAYPLHGTGVGVLLQLDGHETASPPTGPVTAADGDLYVPGYDGNLTRVAADGSDTTLVHNEERIATSAAVAEGLAVVRKDDLLQAVPIEGGEPVWSVPAGNAYSASTPLVQDGTVYAGTSDGRLLALDLADGAERWSAPVSADYLPSTPAAFPDGDVVYGVGLARYDAGSGAAVWSHPDVFAYGAPATADAAVFAAVDRQGDASGFGAWDADSGAPLWFVPATPSSYVGPSVADGVAVFVDAFGTVRALDVRDGTERWSVQLDRSVGGSPAIHDGRVLMAGLGRPEDINQRDYRIAAYDLQSGRFLGSWEPPLTSFWIVPFVSPGADDAVLVPTGQDLKYVVMEVRPRG
jgi:outer membrane protein assembly factor BamB